MYICEEFIDMGLEAVEPKMEWTSPLHRSVAVAICLNNPRITTLESLANNIKIVNSISKDEIGQTTYPDLLKMGCDI